MSYICDMLPVWPPAGIFSPHATPAHSLLRVVRQWVLRTACLLLESLRLQAQDRCNSLLGGGDEQRLKVAAQRAYQRAENPLTHLLSATAEPFTFSKPLPASSHDLR